MGSGWSEIRPQPPCPYITLLDCFLSRVFYYHCSFLAIPHAGPGVGGLTGLRPLPPTPKVCSLSSLLFLLLLLLLVLLYIENHSHNVGGVPVRPVEIWPWSRRDTKYPLFGTPRILMFLHTSLPKS